MDSLIPALMLNMLRCNVIAIVIFSILSLISCYYFLQKPKGAALKPLKPPQVPGAWPILGHLPQLMSKTIPIHITIRDLVNDAGPICLIKLGIFPGLVISSYDLAKECFTGSNDIAISDRPKFITLKHLGYNFAVFSFVPYGTYSRKLRKITISELLSSRPLEWFGDVRADETRIAIKELYKRCSSGVSCVDLKDWFEKSTLNMILRMVAGNRLGDQEDNEMARKFRKAIWHLFVLVTMPAPSDVLPFLGWLDLEGKEKAARKTAKVLDGMLNKWLEEHKNKKKKKEEEGSLCDDHEEGANQSVFMEAMTSIFEGTKFGGFDADTVNKATCQTLIIAGAFSTPGVLTWTLVLLLNNRHALKKLQDELDKYIGKGRVARESDIDNLVYLQAVVKETMRLNPFISYIPRQFTEDCTIGGYHVCKGTRLLINLRKIHTDPTIWSDPLQFKPERFLTTHKNVDARGQCLELLPFGAGRRVCPGSNMALQMIHLMLASLIHAFEIETLGGAPVDMTESTEVAVSLKANPLEVMIKPRLSLDLYE